MEENCTRPFFDPESISRGAEKTAQKQRGRAYSRVNPATPQAARPALETRLP
jgi:hypothetical protein